MKILSILLLIFSNTLLFAQNFNMASIAEAEAKSVEAHITGNRNLNTNNYDLKYQRLELNVDPSHAFISGTITSHFEAKENMNTIIFELVNSMTVSEVTQRGTPLSFTQNTDDEVVITLPQIQNTGVLDSLSVSYSGNPVHYDFDSFAISTHNGQIGRAHV